jgi:hypothetical protein
MFLPRRTEGGASAEGALPLPGTGLTRLIDTPSLLPSTATDTQLNESTPP